MNKKFVVAWILILLICIVLIACSTTNPVEGSEGEIVYIASGGGSIIGRFIDNEFNVLCYISDSTQRLDAEGGIYCIPLKDLE